MAMHEKWPAWIMRSMRKHFDDNTGALAMFAEGEVRKTSGLKDFIEFRFDGPYFTLVSKGYWRVYTEVNILLTSALDEANNDRIHINTGIVAKAFSQLLPILKLGSDVEDDDSQLECMTLLGDTEGRERIQISHFGQIEPKVSVLQASVEGHYEMMLKE